MKNTAFFLIGLMVVISGAARAKEAPLIVPTDSGEYTILEREGPANARTIVTKRVGSSGTSFSKRVYDCGTSTWMYIGTGDTLEAMARSAPDKKMGPILDGSIASYVGRAACAEQVKKLKK